MIPPNCPPVFLREWASRASHLLGSWEVPSGSPGTRQPEDSCPRAWGQEAWLAPLTRLPAAPPPHTSPHVHLAAAWPAPLVCMHSIGCFLLENKHQIYVFTAFKGTAQGRPAYPHRHAAVPRPCASSPTVPTRRLQRRRLRHFSRCSLDTAWLRGKTTCPPKAPRLVLTRWPL